MILMPTLNRYVYNTTFFIHQGDQEGSCNQYDFLGLYQILHVYMLMVHATPHEPMWRRHRPGAGDFDPAPRLGHCA
jgi:hypothetical protein